jgi:hypothetical protein
MLRDLTYEELGYVSGGTDTRGVNETFNGSTASTITNNGGGTIVQATNGVVAEDVNNDGVFDQAWRQDEDGNWETTYTGILWYSDNGPMDEIIQRAQLVYQPPYQEPRNINGL